jgi:hypothetical protein
MAQPGVSNVYFVTVFLQDPSPFGSCVSAAAAGVRQSSHPQRNHISTICAALLAVGVTALILARKNVLATLPQAFAKVRMLHLALQPVTGREQMFLPRLTNDTKG